MSQRVGYRLGDIRFSQRELRDFAIAWLALGVAFTFFLNPRLIQALQYGTVRLGPLARALAVVTTYALAAAVPLLAVTVAVGLGVGVATGRLAALGDRIERASGVVLVLAGVGQVAIAIAPNAIASVVP